jgi:hypothetical protein
MNPIRIALRREMRVAFSRRAQPVWFRVVKWTGILFGVAWFHDRRWFWLTLAGLAAAGTGLHFFYRWKTETWTRAWGGWNDLTAGRD